MMKQDHDSDEDGWMESRHEDRKSDLEVRFHSNGHRWALYTAQQRLRHIVNMERLENGSNAIVCPNGGSSGVPKSFGYAVGAVWRGGRFIVDGSRWCKITGDRGIAAHVISMATRWVFASAKLQQQQTRHYVHR